jgi:hypothetical protein
MSTLPVTEKTIRNLLTTITVFAIASTVLTASSFAAEFTVHEGKRYQAVLKLTGIEQLAENALIARKFTELGFSGVRVSGAGATRRVVGVWPRKDTSARMPPQIVRVAEL